MTRQIIALGGGGFSMEDTPLLDEYVLAACGVARPRVCFIPTASGDSSDYIRRFYAAFNRHACTPDHLELFRRDERDPETRLRGCDAVYVGGGNTANMLSVWRLHGVDTALADAADAGVVLAGISAGAVCWFEAAVTDSFGPELAALNDGLGFLPGSMCPHYDGEPTRRPAYEKMIEAGKLPAGYAADDGAALHFIDGAVHATVASRPSARAYRVSLSPTGTVHEQVLSAS